MKRVHFFIRHFLDCRIRRKDYSRNSLMILAVSAPAQQKNADQYALLVYVIRTEYSIRFGWICESRAEISKIGVNQQRIIDYANCLLIIIGYFYELRESVIVGV